VDFQNKV
jgi:hypothetical protein